MSDRGAQNKLWFQGARRELAAVRRAMVRAEQCGDNPLATFAAEVASLAPVIRDSKQFVIARVKQIRALHHDRDAYLNAMAEDRALNAAHSQFCDLIDGLQAIAEANNLTTTYGQDAVQHALASEIAEANHG